MSRSLKFRFLTLLLSLSAFSLSFGEDEDVDDGAIGGAAPPTLSNDVTVSKLSLDKLDGKWYTLYDKQAGKKCEVLEFGKAKKGATDVTKKVNGKVEKKIKLEQQYDNMQGRLSHIVQEGKQTSDYSWFVLYADDELLVVLRFAENSKKDWSVYSRTASVDKCQGCQLKKLEEKLKKAGAKADGNNALLNKVSHEKCA